jgi:hypothetical protein
MNMKIGDAHILLFAAIVIASVVLGIYLGEKLGVINWTNVLVWWLSQSALWFSSSGYALRKWNTNGRCGNYRGRLTNDREPKNLVRSHIGCSHVVVGPMAFREKEKGNSNPNVCW